MRSADLAYIRFMGRGQRDQGDTSGARLRRSPKLHNPPPPLDPDDDLAEKISIEIWIERDDDQGRVRAEVSAHGYDAALKYDYEIPTAIEGRGYISAELLRKLLSRELVRDLAAELGVSYEEKRP